MRKRRYHYKVSYPQGEWIVTLEGEVDFPLQAYKLAKAGVIRKLAKQEGISHKIINVEKFQRLNHDNTVRTKRSTAN